MGIAPSLKLSPRLWNSTPLLGTITVAVGASVGLGGSSSGLSLKPGQLPLARPAESSAALARGRVCPQGVPVGRSRQEGREEGASAGPCFSALGRSVVANVDLGHLPLHSPPSCSRRSARARIVLVPPCPLVPKALPMRRPLGLPLSCSLPLPLPLGP